MHDDKTACQQNHVPVQALCKTSGSTLGYGFPTMDLDEDDGIGSVNGDGAADLPLIEAVP